MEDAYLIKKSQHSMRLKGFDNHAKPKILEWLPSLHCIFLNILASWLRALRQTLMVIGRSQELVAL